MLDNLNLSDLKKLNNFELEKLAEEIRKVIIETVSKKGGHLSSNLGMVELTIMMHKVFESPKDLFFFDVSHQTYAHKILTGRLKEFSTLGSLNGISGFSKASESVHDIYEMGHSSTSISAALGFLEAKKTYPNLFNDLICVIGDGSLTNGIAFEAINYLTTVNEKMIIIINDNSMCISEMVGAIHNNYHNLFTNLGFEYIDNVNGHSFEELEKALFTAKQNKVTTVLHVHTIKGKGYKFAEDDKIGIWHRVSPFNIKTGEFLLEENKINSLFGEKIAEHLIKNMDETIRVITPGMSVGCGIEKIKEVYPNNFIDTGIAEENTMIMAGAMAQAKLKPIVFTYSTFYERGFGEILHDITRTNQNVILCADRSGIVGADGDTHQGIFDIGFLGILPNLKLLAPANSTEACQMLDFVLKNNGPVLIRYPKVTNEIEYDIHFEYGSWQVLKESNKKVVIITYGPTVLEFNQNLKDKDITLVNASTIKDIDEKLINNFIKEEKELYIVEEVIKEGSLYNIICNKFINSNIKIHSISLENTYLEVGSVSELKGKYRLTINDVLSKIEGDDRLVN